MTSVPVPPPGLQPPFQPVPGSRRAPRGANSRFTRPLGEFLPADDPPLADQAFGPAAQGGPLDPEASIGSNEEFPEDQFIEPESPRLPPTPPGPGPDPGLGGAQPPRAVSRAASSPPTFPRRRPLGCDVSVHSEDDPDGATKHPKANSSRRPNQGGASHAGHISPTGRPRRGTQSSAASHVSEDDGPNGGGRSPTFGGDGPRQPSAGPSRRRDEDTSIPESGTPRIPTAAKGKGRAQQPSFRSQPGSHDHPGPSFPQQFHPAGHGDFDDPSRRRPKCSRKDPGARQKYPASDDDSDDNSTPRRNTSPNLPRSDPSMAKNPNSSSSSSSSSSSLSLSSSSSSVSESKRRPLPNSAFNMSTVVAHNLRDHWRHHLSLTHFTARLMRDFLAVLCSNEGLITSPFIVLLQESDLPDIARNLRPVIIQNYRYKRGKDVGLGTARWVADRWYMLIMAIADSETLYDDFPTAVLYLQRTLFDWEASSEKWTISVSPIREPVWTRYHHTIVSQCAHFAKILPTVQAVPSRPFRATTSEPSLAGSSSSAGCVGFLTTTKSTGPDPAISSRNLEMLSKIPSSICTASVTTATAALTPRVSTNISVANVAPVTIPLKPILHPTPLPDPTPLPKNHNLFPVVTRLRHEAWTRLLIATDGYEKFKKVPEGLRDGFLIGVEDYKLSHTFTPKNHPSASTYSHVISEKFNDEIAKGRISIGFELSYLESIIGPFRTSPLAVIEQKPGKFRIIINHSYPHTPPHIQRLLNPPSSSSSTSSTSCATDHDPSLIIIDPEIYSVNSLIDTDKFQCAWGTFSECWLLIANAPPGTQASVFDVDAAFRNIPIHPSARNFVALLFNGLVHLDQCLNFGKASSPGIWGLVADAMVHILLNSGVEALIKWVDDFIFFRYPRLSLGNGIYEYAYDENLVWSIAEELGWPWALLKFVAFAVFFTYIGFFWNIEKKTVELPQNKKTKYSMKISTFLSSPSHTKEDAESMKRSSSLPPKFAVEPHFNTLRNPNLSDAAAAAIAGSVVSETRRRQQLIVTEFAVWANDMGLHPDEVLPAPETFLCEFAASFLGRRAGGTVKAKISALKSWHLNLGFKWNGADLLRRALTGIDHQAPPSSHRPERPPVTKDMMRSLHTACILGQLRCGELFPKNSDPRLFDPSKHPRVQDVQELPPPTPQSKYGPMAMFLPSTKTEIFKGDEVHIHAYHGSLNATKATHAHVRANRLSPQDPFMSYRDDSGKLKVMTKSYFLALCNEVWEKEGYPRFTGHSFRIGSTSLLLQDSVNPEYVKMCGRWKSSAFTRYWRDLHTCATVHIDRVHARNRLHQCLNA
ncbi:hypothetical protein D9758_017658 [Tetrapyrgos nigripes]|uniref:Uncharacterized protein n=1 Tax=Tetrapyrgos nigripes TaxID=182062 RepID=A0A8H5C2W2_9AGAR|nr:hypothetical protein D9758_017658 [Tetrapyrgos nigripes]